MIGNPTWGVVADPAHQEDRYSVWLRPLVEMDIEEVAANTPEKIHAEETIDPAGGFRSFQARKLAFGLGIPGDLIGQASQVSTQAL